ncbi:hypothetical protein CCB80_13670 [Armatimonadetes bacterium Uphvl-Ar1]|nr:hypothetical protein CCB80_13670 [Armatimonadetes bacterium Uphvl-Ar1]
MNRGTWPLIVAVGLDLAGFTMIIPDIQLRAEAFLERENWQLPPFLSVGVLIGFILSSMFIVQFFVSPIWGAKSDVWGRKRVFLGCTLLSALSMGIYAIAWSSPILLLSRILAGLGGANVAVAQASIADGSREEVRTAALGKMSAAQSVGLICGPAIGGFVAEYLGSQWVGWIGMGMSLTGAFLVWRFGHFGRAAEVGTRRKFGFGPLVREFPRLLPLVVLAGAAWFSLSALEGTFARLLDQTWSYGQREFGMLFSFEAVIGLVIQAVVLGVIIKYVKDPVLLVGSYLLQGIGLAMTPFAPGLSGLFLASFLYAVGTSVANPTVNGLCSKAVSEDRQGEVFGVIQSARSVGFMLGPLVGGALFDFWSPLPYLFAGGICVLVAFMAPLALPRAAKLEA